MDAAVLVAGSGPAALAAAVACARRGLQVTVLGGEDRPWIPNYGGWVEELAGVGLADDLGPVWPDAQVVFDDSGPVSTRRAYARVHKERLRARLLSECATLGVEVLWQQAVAVDHAPRHSTVTDDDGRAHTAQIVVDATGHRSVFVRRSGEPTLFQAAVGRWGKPTPNPWPVDRMVFMDLRQGPWIDKLGTAVPTFLYAMPLGPERVFVEETSLVRGPAVPFAILRARLDERLGADGISGVWDDEEELCLFPMDNPVPDLHQRVVGFGAAASMVHPASGYQLARAFGTAPRLADALATSLTSGAAPAAVARSGWQAIWSREDLVRHELHLLGTRVVAGLDADDTRRFFETFFAMPEFTWTRYLAATPRVRDVMGAMMSMWWQGDRHTRLTLTRSGLGLGAVFHRALS